MVICGLIVQFSVSRGVLNDLIVLLGGERTSLLSRTELFQPIYVLSEIWQEFGWGSLIYLAALAGIDFQLYESAKIDGANRWKQIWHITIPGIMPTISILLILRMGDMMTVGFEKIILLYNPSIYESADVISTFIYRKGLQQLNFSYGTAVGLLNTVVNFVFLISANMLSRKVNENSLW